MDELTNLNPSESAKTVLKYVGYVVIGITVPILTQKPIEAVFGSDHFIASRVIGVGLVILLLAIYAVSAAKLDWK